MMNDDLDRVVPLDQLDDFKVADGDPDVRGWEVVASDGRRIGEVDQLLVDTAAMKVRYLDVDVDEGLLAGGSDRHVLIPIGYARLDERDDRVLVDNLASADIAGLPEYNQGPLTRDYESDLRTRFDTAYTGGAGALSAGMGTGLGVGTGLGMGMGTDLGTAGAAADLGGTTRSTDVSPADAGFYAHDLYDDNRFYGARRGPASEREGLSGEGLLGKENQVAGTESVDADLRGERGDVDRTGEMNLRDGLRDDRL